MKLKNTENAKALPNLEFYDTIKETNIEMFPFAYWINEDEKIYSIYMISDDQLTEDMTNTNLPVELIESEDEEGNPTFEVRIMNEESDEEIISTMYNEIYKNFEELLNEEIDNLIEEDTETEEIIEEDTETEEDLK